MPKKLIFTSKEVMKILENHDFILHRTKGSHHIYIRKEDKRIAVVPLHYKELPRGTCNSILKQAGIDKKKLLD